MKVWSFSPPPDEERPFVIAIDDPNRPKSALAIDYRQSQPAIFSGMAHDAEEDIDMRDAGPSTAPLQAGSTFFHD